MNSHFSHEFPFNGETCFFIIKNQFLEKGLESLLIFVLFLKEKK